MPGGAFAERYGPWGVVTGAGQGLGAAYADALATRGLDLLLVDRRADLLAAVAAPLERAHGVRVVPLVVDLAGPGAVDEIVRAAGGRDVGLLVCNAAWSRIGGYLEAPADEHRAAIAVNCLAPALLAHHFGRRMQARGRGGIILMASLAGFQGQAYVAQYAATKAYNLVLGEGLWDELGEHGVDVLACCPGATLTPSYLAARPPRRVALLSPPEMEPAAVVREALAALGRQPSVIAGRANRAGAVVLQRLLSRLLAVKLMGRVGRGLRRS
jgi:short-subunit dehydrogenase